MTSISPKISIDDPTVKAIDTSKLAKFNIAESDEETFQNYLQHTTRFLEGRYTSIEPRRQNGSNEANDFVATVDRTALQADPLYQSLGKIQAAREVFLSGKENKPELNAEAQRLKASYQSWKADYMSSGISSERVAELNEHSDNFTAIMEKSVAESGYSEPLQFIAKLSPAERETLRVINGLAQSIDPQSLGEEGALNLLLPKSEARDLNNDGFTMNGIARNWSFPPPNAPDSVKAAWDEATKDMSAGDKMLAMAPFMPSLIQVDEAGIPREIEPSEANNIYAATDFSYTDFVQARLDALEYFKAQTSKAQYERSKAFLTQFMQSLNTHLAP